MSQTNTEDELRTAQVAGQLVEHRIIRKKHSIDLDNFEEWSDNRLRELQDEYNRLTQPKDTSKEEV